MKTFFRHALSITLVSTLLALALSAYAALTVVGDFGGDPTAPFFEAINAGNDTGAEVSQTPSPRSAPVLISDMLPVSTPEMSPGTVEARALNLIGMPPVFVLGDDAVSRQWLIHHASDLRRLQATGLIISVRDERGLNALRQLAPDIVMVPVSGSVLSHRLSLEHYPVLITATGISQ
ncbi:integrating conjugative element protein [Lonsdalea quercina]|uniref:integrating conjugative element protein n=1 Tax=Lonsdalea quercina TaxID=71657 RepID=UPI0039750C2F